MKTVLLWGLCLLHIASMRNLDTAGSFFVHADTDSVSTAIVTGDSLVGLRVNGEGIEYIYGNVYVTQDSTVLRSNQAQRFIDRRTINFVGRVRMYDQGDTLTADTLYYDEDSKIGQARSNVRLTDGDMVAQAPEVDHYFDEKWSIFPTGVRLEDSTITLTGQSGEYWTQEKRAEFANQVHMISEDITLWADSLTHLRSARQSTARGNVLVEQSDGPDTTRIAGQWVFHDDQAKTSEFRGFPLLVQLQQDSLSVDTLVISAGHLWLDESDEDNRELLASRRIQIWNHDIAATSDSMVYRQAGSVQSILLLGEPVLWVEDSQVTGDTIRVRLDDGTLDSLFAYGEAFVAQLDSASGRINQAKGRTLVGVSERDSVRSFTLGPNAEVLFHYHEEDVGPDGALTASGDVVILRMINDELNRIKFGTGVQGTRYPEESLPANLSLEGLQWLPELRPNKEELLSGFAARIDQGNS